MRKELLTAAFALWGLGTMAQNIDFDFPGRQSSEVTEPNYVAWPVGRVASESKTLEGGMTITVSPGNDATSLASNWNKNIVQKNSKLLGDGVFACHLEDGNYVWITEGSTAIVITIEGMTPGQHSVLAYHNDTDAGQKHPDVEVSVNGEVKGSGFKHSSGATKLSESGSSFVEFTVEEGQPVVIKFASTPKAGETYDRTSVMVNGLEFDTNPYVIMDPMPENFDYHVDADDGSVHFSWLPADIAVSHKLALGTDSMAVVQTSSYQYEGTAAQYAATGLSPLQRYYWRVDEVDAEGNVHKGKVLTFQPRRLAFPGAEGYGRFAIGGRGGVVYHVTTLDDNGSDDDPIEGSLRYGIKKVSGPRTIVFDVAGPIALKSRLTCSDNYVTIAGQTAPGNGVMLRTCAFGMQSDGITRFMRMRLGHKKLVSGVIPGTNNGQSYGSEAGTSDETTLGGLDGMGMTGNDNAIMDHCSISWTIDEAFSSRNAKGITLQRTLISEALNIAGHPNYNAGNAHGFAGTIGGGQMGGKPGSFHHNLLAHNSGRNWSISGGLDGKGFYDGAHDVFNTVVYNWDGRTTDGGTHEMNFVNNYYKVGPVNGTKVLLNAQLEGTGQGTQSYYVSGNVRDNMNGTLTQDAYGNTYKYTKSSEQVLDWEVFLNQPFFPSYATIETAEAAYKNVLSDVGCNQPFFDLHDQRMVRETLNRTSTTKGSRSGKKGLIDSEEDEGCEGFDLEKLGIVVTQRDANWDTDQDGIPNWFEQIVGTSPSTPNNNDDRDGDLYTDLEEYLNWVAVPNFIVATAEEKVIDLKPYFAGYKNPTFEASPVTDNGVTSNIDAATGTMTFSDRFGNRLSTVYVTATEDGIKLTREFHFAATGAATPKKGDINGDGYVDVGDIMAIINFMANPAADTSAFDLNDDKQVDVGDIMAIINIMAQ